MVNRTNRPADHPSVSVIMNCFNGSEFLREAIESVYAQTYKDWEIVFWDNASTDSSADIAKGYGERLRYFRGDETIPLGHARNLAIGKTRGDYIAFLDCDDVWLPEKLEKQVALIKRPAADGAEVGLCYTDAMRMDSEGNDLLPYRNRVYDGRIYEELIKDCFISCSSCMVSGDALKATGGINEKYKMVEEWDLWLRITRDYGAACVEERLTRIRTHSSNQSRKILETLDESMEVISRIKTDDRRIASVRDGKLKELEIRGKIVELLDTSKGLGLRRLNTLIKTLRLFVFNPRVGLSFIRRYFNTETYNLYKSKYRKNG